jgi:O-acetylhomoserine (thiol)-lyase
MAKTYHPETLALHAGWRADPATTAVAVPIYQTTSYQFVSAVRASNLFALKELGSRIVNPTTDVLGQRLAALEGGYGGLVDFELKAGAEAGRAFIDALEAFYHVANIGDTAAWPPTRPAPPTPS